MATTLEITKVTSELEPEAPLTLIHIGVTGNYVSGTYALGFDYDYNTATADTPTLCQKSAGELFDYDPACED